MNRDAARFCYKPISISRLSWQSWQFSAGALEAFGNSRQAINIQATAIAMTTRSARVVCQTLADHLAKRAAGGRGDLSGEAASQLLRRDMGLGLLLPPALDVAAALRCGDALQAAFEVSASLQQLGLALQPPVSIRPLDQTASKPAVAAGHWGREQLLLASLLPPLRGQQRQSVRLQRRPAAAPGHSRAGWDGC